MILDFIAIGILIICISAIVWIVSNKFPVLASINTTTLQKHKQEKVKKELLEDRLLRKFKAVNFKHYFSRQPNENSKSIWQSLIQVVSKLEKKYEVQKNDNSADVGNIDEQVKKKNFLLHEGETLFNDGKYKEAEAIFIEAISLDPKFIPAYQLLSELYQAQRDYNHAKEILHYLLKINSTDHTTYQHLGRLATVTGQLKEAEADYLKSISLNNKVASYYFDLGEIYIKLNNVDKAYDSYREAVRLEPNNPKILDALITTAILLKNKKDAQEFFDKLNEVNPENDKLEEFKKGIKAL